MTSIVVYFIASIVAIRALRSHKIGRWYAVLILLAGVTTPMLSSAITSTFRSFVELLSICLFSSPGALLSAMFYAASVEIRPFFCFVLGVGQTGVVLFFSFLKILSTLWRKEFPDEQISRRRRSRFPIEVGTRQTSNLISPMPRLSQSILSSFDQFSRRNGVFDALPIRLTSVSTKRGDPLKR